MDGPWDRPEHWSKCVFCSAANCLFSNFRLTQGSSSPHSRLHGVRRRLYCRRRPSSQQLQPRRYLSHYPFLSPPSDHPANDFFRPGFLALAQFPIVFLFATKNSIVSLLLGPGNGYEKLNFIHRWSGRIMFLGSMLHGALWIRNHLEYDLPIIGQQKEGSGVAALGLLGVVVLSSLPFVRRWAYQVFYVVQ